MHCVKQVQWQIGAIERGKFRKTYFSEQISSTFPRNSDRSPAKTNEEETEASVIQSSG